MNKLISLGLVFLILSMPISFASTFTVDSYGQDEVSGLIRGKDVVTLSARVQGEPVSEEDLVYMPTVGPTRNFDSCDGEYCTLKLDEDVYRSVEDFKIRFRSSEGSKDRVAKALVDSIGARIESARISENLVSPNDNIEFDISVRDTACSNLLCNGKCSGIESVKIFKGTSNKEVYEISVGTKVDECTESFQEVIPVDDLDLDEGDNTLYLRAYDAFGNTPENFKSLIINVDSTPPGLGDDTFYLLKDGFPLTYYSYSVPGVDVKFYLEEEVKSARADLSSLNPSLGFVDMNCQGLACSKRITLNPTVTRTSGKQNLEIRVELEDELGNKDIYNLDNQLSIDKEGPSVDKVESTARFKDSDVVGMGSTSKFMIEFDEKDSGMLQANAFLDLSSVNPSKGLVKAESCDEDSVCTFPSVEVINEGLLTVKVLGVSKDDAGNSMGSDYTFQVKADKTIPRVISVSLDFSDIEVEGFPTRDDEIKIDVVLEDSSEIEAVGNFSAITDDKGGIIEERCRGSSTSRSGGGFSSRGSSSSSRSDVVLQDGQSLCSFEVEIEKSGFIENGVASLFFTDEFGNTLQYDVPLPIIYARYNDPDPNYWTVSNLQCSPKTMDRRMGELMEMEKYCSFDLVPSTDYNQEIALIGMVGCDSPYIKEAEVNNIGENPYVRLIFEQDEYEVNTLNINCTLSIISMIDDSLVIDPELESFVIENKFFNLPYGMPDDVLVNKIEDITETWSEGFGEFMFWLTKFEKIASTICKGRSALNGVMTTLSLGAGAVPDMYGGCGVRAGTDKANQASDTLTGTLGKFCAYVNCEKSFANVGNRLQASLPGSQMLDSWGGDFTQYQNVKNNFILSVANLCIPGIIVNLEKYRQIQCFYGYCLLDMTAEGMPIEFCEETKGYQTCKYFTTAIFTVFPIVNFIDNTLENVKGVLSDPFVALGYLANIACVDCSQTSWGLCRITRVINVATQAYTDFNGVMSSYKEWDLDYCEELSDAAKGFELDSLTRSTSGRGKA